MKGVDKDKRQCWRGLLKMSEKSFPEILGGACDMVKLTKYLGATVKNIRFTTIKLCEFT